MNALYFDPRRLFIRCFLLTVFFHALFIVAFSFTLKSRAPERKPLMTFLGSILSSHDLEPDETVKQPWGTIPREGLRTMELIKSRTMTPKFSESDKPTFSTNLAPLERKQFKPPKELYISQDVLTPDPDDDPQSVPAREPLRWKGP